ncbi:MAG TPA: acetylglutamate kinase [Candidatus Hypogeohydataceae bacterium YC41]
MEEAIRKAEVLIEALPYIKAFKDRMVVIKLGGSALAELNILQELLEDVIFMKTTGMRPVLVHGGGPHITQEMARKGKQPQFIQGHRVTDAETLEIVVDVLVNQVNATILRELERLGNGGVNLWRKGRPPLEAEKYTPVDSSGNPLDLGYVGELSSIDIKAFSRACSGGKVPVIPPLAHSRRGDGILNVNADSVASFLAVTLKAEKLVFLSNTHGIMLNPAREDSIASTLSREEVDSLIQKEVITGGMLPKARACLKALEGGVGKAHIIDGRIPHSLLLEIFTHKGIGTQIVL